MSALAAVLLSSFGLANLPAKASAPRDSTSPAFTDPRTLPRTQAPAPLSPSVTALATPHGIVVSWQNAPDNAQSFSVWRTDSSNNTVELTVGRHSGKGFNAVSNQYTDHTAVPGQTYTYTVKVATIGQTGKTASSSSSPVATVGETLGTAQATAVAQAQGAGGLGQLPSTPSPRSPHVSHTARTARTVKAASLPKASGIAPKISNVSGCTISDGGVPGGGPSAPGSPITVAGSVTWADSATCPDGYLLNDDIIIPSGASVTLAPGTTLYVLAGTASNDSSWSGASETDPTAGVDIVDQGTLNIAGAAGNVATITSSQADPTCSADIPTTTTTSSTTTSTPPCTSNPAPGDWGDIFYDGSAGNTGTVAGSIGYAVIQYGNKVLADHYALPLSNTTISQMYGSGIDGGNYAVGLDLLDFPAGATEAISNLTYDGTNTGGSSPDWNGDQNGTGAEITSYVENDLSGAAYHGNGISLNITGSHFNGYWPLYVEDDSNAATDPTGTGNASINFNLSGNTFNAIRGGVAFSPEAYQSNDYGVSVATKTAQVSGSATVTGTSTNDTFSTDDSCGDYCGEGFYPYAETSYSSASAGQSNSTCAPGSYGSCVRVSLANDQISGYSIGLDSESYVDDGTGDAVSSVTSNGGAITSGGADYANPVYEDVEQTGTAGNADNYSSMNGTTTTGGNGNYAYAESDNGSATSSPSFVNGSIQANSSRDGVGLFNQAVAADSGTTPGSATANPTISGTNVFGYYAALFNEAYSHLGAATASPTLTGGTWTENASNTDLAVCDNPGRCEGASLIGNGAIAGDSEYGPATGAADSTVNDAVANPSINGITGTAATWDDLVNYARSEWGAASAQPSVVDSTLSAGTGTGIDNEAYGSADDNPDSFTGTGGGTATASPVIAGTTLRAYEDALYNYADSNYGGASADPAVEPDGQGAQSHLSGSTGSTMSTVGCYLEIDNLDYCYYGIDNEAYSNDEGSGGSTTGASAEPTLSNSTLDSYLGIYTIAQSGDDTTNSDANTTINNSTVTAYFNPLDAEAYSAWSGTGATQVLTNISGSTLTGREGGDGVYTNSSSGSGSSGSSEVGGTVQNSTIQSPGVAYEAEGMSGTGPMTFDTTFNNDTLTSTDQEDIYSSMTPCNSGTAGGSVLADPTINGGTYSAPRSEAIYLEDAGYGTHASDLVEVAPSISGAQITSWYEGLFASAYDTGSWPGLVHVGGKIVNSTINSEDDEGILSRAETDYETGGAVVDTTVTNTSVFAYRTAAYFESYSDGGSPATASPTITSNALSTIDSYDRDAVDSVAETDSGGAATNSPTISGVHLSGYGTDDWCYGGGGGYCGYAYSDSGAASNSGSITNNLIDNRWQSDDDTGIDQETYTDSGSTPTDTSTISGNTVTGMLDDTDGIFIVYGAEPGVGPTITKNVISGVSGDGIYLDGSDGYESFKASFRHHDGSEYSGVITGNSVVDTGGNGVTVLGTFPQITGNWQSLSGQSGSGSGIEVADGYGGSVTCNAVTGNTTGVSYSGNDGTDPNTEQNAFAMGGLSNGPVNLSTDNGSESPSDATNNWWGPYSPAQLAASILGSVNVGSTGNVFQNVLSIVDGVPTAAGNPNGSVTGPPACVPTGPLTPISPYATGGGGGAPANTGNCPPSTVSCQSGQTTATNGGTTATGSGGSGSISVGQYGSNPVGNLVSNTGSYIDVRVGSGSSYTSVNIQDCSLNGGTTLSWWNPSANGGSGAWQPVAGDPGPTYSAGPPACVTVTLSPSTSPTISQLTGTVFGAVNPRLAGANRIGTAVAVSQAEFPAAGSAKGVVLARQDDFADALAGGPLAAHVGGPLLLTESTGLDPVTATEISRVLAPGGTVYVLGGSSAVASSVDSTLTGNGYKVQRLAGADRFATAVAVAQAMGNPSTVFLATGTNFPDALAAGPAAVVKSGAILLTNGTKQSAATSAYLSSLTSPTVYAIGGPAAQADPAATPIVGADRNATAVMVASQFFKSPSTVGIATGLDFPDALAAGPYLGSLGAPLLLVAPSGVMPGAGVAGGVPAAVATYLKTLGAATSVLGFGGTNTIPAAVLSTVMSDLG